MTVAIPVIDISTDKFGDWVTKTNNAINAIRNSVVTIGGSPAVGDAEIVGNLKVSSLNATTGTFGSMSISGNATLANAQIVTPLGISSGGTGASTLSGARANLQIGSVGSTNYPATATGLVLTDDGTFKAVTSGTVTSINMSMPTGFSLSGNPITTSGTIAVTYSPGYRGYTNSEATKLSNVAENATQNQTDAYLLTRSNHTGQQSISTVANLQSTLDGKQATIPNGTTGQYYRGDKSWATLNSAAVGLDRVANKSEQDMVNGGAIANAINSKLNTNQPNITGDIARINGSTPRLEFLWGGAFRKDIRMGSDGSINFTNTDWGNTSHIFTTDGNVWRANRGWLNDELNQKANTWDVNDRVHRIRLVGWGELGSDNTNNFQHRAPGVCTAARGQFGYVGIIVLGFKTLQQHIPAVGGYIDCFVE